MDRNSLDMLQKQGQPTNRQYNLQALALIELDGKYGESAIIDAWAFVIHWTVFMHVFAIVKGEVRVERRYCQSRTAKTKCRRSARVGTDDGKTAGGYT